MKLVSIITAASIFGSLILAAIAILARVFWSKEFNELQAKYDDEANQRAARVQAERLTRAARYEVAYRRRLSPSNFNLESSK